MPDVQLPITVAKSDADKALALLGITEHRFLHEVTVGPRKVVVTYLRADDAGTLHAVGYGRDAHLATQITEIEIDPDV